MQKRVYADWLPPHGQDSTEDHDREVEAGFVASSELGDVFVNWIDLDEDHWTAIWQRGHDFRSVDAGRAQVISWALSQEAGNRWIFSAAADEWVPLTADEQEPRK